MTKKITKEEVQRRIVRTIAPNTFLSKYAQMTGRLISPVGKVGLFIVDEHGRVWYWDPYTQRRTQTVKHRIIGLPPEQDLLHELKVHITTGLKLDGGRLSDLLEQLHPMRIKPHPLLAGLLAAGVAEIYPF